MSASAGRVLIIPKGEYDASVTYTMLDMVYYSGKSYICKQTTVGHDPTNTVYWQIMLDNVGSFANLTDVDLTDLQNGDGIAYNATTHKWENTTPVGITITSPPATVDYVNGDILDLTGMVVMAEYSTGQTRNITTECTFSPANGTTLTASNTSVIVTWRTFTATQAITVVVPIYGVEWDGTSTTAWTRTDASVNFTDPVPYYAGMSGLPSSPFDNISPWKDMTVVEDANAGSLVKIPKFYYKLSSAGTNGMKIQISESSHDGFVVSPAHMDRGDGQGERDFVYVGRYKCGATAYKSVAGQNPKTGVQKSTFRNQIHNIGTDIWMIDFATNFTIWLLYLVEFANWNSQSKIGYGCGDGSNYGTLGYTDSMAYHTGTTQNSRTTYGFGTQYRNIEGLWDNVYEILDGCYLSNYKLYIILNPSDFSGSNGVEIGTISSGFPSGFNIKDITGVFPLFVPKSNQGSDSTYSCDEWNNNNNALLFRGGQSYNSLSYGLFMIGTGTPTVQSGSNGTRIMKLPNAS